MKHTKSLFLLFSVCVFAFSAANLRSALESSGKSEPSQSQTQEITEQEGAQYTLLREGEKLAVYRGGVKVAAVSVSFDDLPADERLLLESGVCVADEAQLIAMLEDYTS